MFSSYSLQTAESARINKKKERRQKRKQESALPPLHYEQVTSYEQEPFEHASNPTPLIEARGPYSQSEASNPTSQKRRR